LYGATVTLKIVTENSFKADSSQVEAVGRSKREEGALVPRILGF